MFFYEKIVVLIKISTFDNFKKASKNPIKTDALFCNIFGFDVLIYYCTTKILQNRAMCKALKNLNIKKVLDKSKYKLKKG